jgi:ELWxxDGT repeat protein
VTTALIVALTGLAQAKSPPVLMVADINPGTNPSSPGVVFAIDDHSVLFAAFEPSAGRELWRSDHPYSASATRLVKDIRPGSASAGPGRSDQEWARGLLQCK